MKWNKNDDNENITISILSKKIILVFIVKKNKIGTLQKDIIFCTFNQKSINPQKNGSVVTTSRVVLKLEIDKKNTICTLLYVLELFLPQNLFYCNYVQF